MENIVKVAIILSVATAAVAGIDPKNFQCTSKSPTSNPVFSDTNPKVALTHIFCGEIKLNKKRKKEAKGFHSRYLANRNTGPQENNNPQCARATGSLYQNEKLCSEEDMITQYTFESEGIEVYDGTTHIKKGTNKGNRDKFFPDAWTPEHVVDVIVRTYHACKDKVEDKKVCMKNYVSENEKPLENEVFSIMIFTDGSDTISTAFPIDKESRPDECHCDYNDPKVNSKFKDVKMPHTDCYDADSPYCYTST